MEYASTSSLSDISNEDIVALCSSAPRICNDLNNTKVVKILPDIAVKYGSLVKQSEATTQDYAFRHIDKSILRVPQVYRYFTHGESLFGGPVGYLVMQFVVGVTLEACETTSDLIKRIVAAMKHISSLPMPPSQGPGPLHGGIPHGPLWGDYGPCTAFASVQAMEDYVNERVDVERIINQRMDARGAHSPRISLRSDPLVFCHMDIARRNIILTEANELFFIDWGCAGFYPAFFQRFCLEYCGLAVEAPFSNSLLQHMPGSYKNNEHYSLGAVLRMNAMYHPSFFEERRRRNS